MTRLISANVYALRPSSGATPPATVDAIDLRRTDLWDLPGGCHCPIVGTCLPIEHLRQRLDELFAGSSGLSDFDLHAGVVRECDRRNAVSELVQQELDLLHAAAIDRVAGACAEAHLVDHWHDAVRQGDVTGALWAIVAHPLCRVELQERLLRDLHMVQHRAFALLREERGARERLDAENRELRQALERVSVVTTGSRLQ